MAHKVSVLNKEQTATELAIRIARLGAARPPCRSKYKKIDERLERLTSYILHFNKFQEKKCFVAIIEMFQLHVWLHFTAVASFPMIMTSNRIVVYNRDIKHKLSSITLSH